VSGAGSLKSPGKRDGADFSARQRQRACQDPLTQQVEMPGGDALRPTPKFTLVATSELSFFLLFDSTTLLDSQGSDSAWEICNSGATLCDK
jgi:hypothetical protein